jgi:hypothetical protein
MSDLLNHIAGQVDKIADTQTAHGERLTAIETHQKIRIGWRGVCIAIVGLLLTAAALFIPGG